MTLHLRIHDVGHGHAVHAFTPSGHVVVVDLGCSSSFSPLSWLRAVTDTIDKLVITHPHGDHIDEILDLAEHDFRVRQLWRPKWLTEDEIYDANQSSYDDRVERYLEMSASYSEPIPSNELVGNPSVTGGLRIATFAARGCGRSNINNHSGVVVFQYLGLKVVIPGDNEPPSWRELLQNPSFVTSAKGADVFLASHHGRESGYLADLFDPKTGIGKPRLCVVSDREVSDTDATDSYASHARGWRVHSRGSSAPEDRFCVTTRSDGYVEINIGQNDDRPYLSVTAD
jgi:competence protein ComEC